MGEWSFWYGYFFVVLVIRLLMMWCCIMMKNIIVGSMVSSRVGNICV